MIYAIVVGLIDGWLTGQVMKGGGYGIVMDIVLGLLGGIIGGWVFGSMTIHGTSAPSPRRIPAAACEQGRR